MFVCVVTDHTHTHTRAQFAGRLSWRTSCALICVFNLLPSLSLTRAGRKALDPAHEPPAEGEGSPGTLPSLCSAADACRGGDKSLARGVRSKYVLRGLADVGVMQQVEIGHDNSGVSPGEGHMDTKACTHTHTHTYIHTHTHARTHT